MDRFLLTILINKILIEQTWNVSYVVIVLQAFCFHLARTLNCNQPHVGNKHLPYFNYDVLLLTCEVVRHKILVFFMSLVSQHFQCYAVCFLRVWNFLGEIWYLYFEIKVKYSESVIRLLPFKTPRNESTHVSLNYLETNKLFKSSWGFANRMRDGKARSNLSWIEGIASRSSFLNLFLRLFPKDKTFSLKPQTFPYVGRPTFWIFKFSEKFVKIIHNIYHHYLNEGFMF